MVWEARYRCHQMSRGRTVEQADGREDRRTGEHFHNPLHVHVVKGKGKTMEHAKFTLQPVELIENHGLSNSELKMAEAVIEENKDLFAERWNEFFNRVK